jgi:hypothetical protein
MLVYQRVFQIHQAKIWENIVSNFNISGSFLSRKDCFTLDALDISVPARVSSSHLFLGTSGGLWCSLLSLYSHLSLEGQQVFTQGWDRRPSVSGPDASCLMLVCPDKAWHTWVFYGILFMNHRSVGVRSSEFSGFLMALIPSENHPQ